MPTDLVGNHKADVDELLNRHEREPSHVRQVARLADQLFVALQDWHRLKPGDRILLHLAALMHDIGWSVTGADGKGHHKESARLIRNHPWRNLSSAEREWVAQTARYHRKSLPSIADHPEFAALDPGARTRVEILAGILRIADGLDRQHLGKVLGVAGNWDLLGLQISVFGDAIHEEITAAKSKSDLLKRAFRGEVIIVQAAGWSK